MLVAVFPLKGHQGPVSAGGGPASERLGVGGGERVHGSQTQAQVSAGPWAPVLNTCGCWASSIGRRVGQRGLGYGLTETEVRPVSLSRGSVGTRRTADERPPSPHCAECLAPAVPSSLEAFDPSLPPPFERLVPQAQFSGAAAQCSASRLLLVFLAITADFKCVCGMSGPRVVRTLR